MNKTNNKTKSQSDRVLSVLTRKTRNTLTASQAQRDLGIKNLRARIFDLRNDGYEISTEARKTRNGSVEFYYTMTQ
jgi:uncharacterized coiled-coil DUF342 family protein